MAVPDFQSFMLPVLQLTADGTEHSLVELRTNLSTAMGISHTDLEEKIPSGSQTKYMNRVYWSTVYLSKAGALRRVRRGVVAITDRGKLLLSQNHAKITTKLLQQFPEFTEFYRGSQDSESESNNASITTAVDRETPEERLESSFSELQASLASEILELVKKSSPEFFEELVVKLLVAMGYGGSVKDAGQAVGRSGDDGIDGIIKEDKLGLDVVYIQAKKWIGTVVGRPVVQSFAGSLEGQRARKGIMITTSSFSQDAKEYVNRIEKKIVLIDGRQLAELMIDHNDLPPVFVQYRIRQTGSDPSPV